MKKTIKIQRLYNHLIAPALILLAATSVFGFGGSAMPSTERAAPEITAEMTALTIPVRQQKTGKILQVPLFSEKYAKLPVAMVDEEPITLKEFSLELASMHSNMESSDSPAGQNFNKMLERLITIKLVKQEALNIGFDRTPAVQSQVKNFALKLMIKQLLAQQVRDIQVPEREVDELYQQMAVEAKLLTYSFAEKADAEAVLVKHQEGGDFKKLADEAVASGKATGGEEPKFARLNDLFPAVAKAVLALEIGGVSEIFKAEKGHLLFRLEKLQVYDDPEVRLAAANRLMQRKSKQVQFEYLESLVEKYVVFDEEVEAALDFAKIATENPGIEGTELFSRLSNDRRPLATISDGQETSYLRVADIADKVKATMYHGLDREIDGENLNHEKETAIWNALVAGTGKLEAQAQKIDQTLEFKEKIGSFEEQVLFDTFMAKAVVPGIKVPEEDAKAYYYNHLEDYSSPLMLKMKSLVFTQKAAALDAFKKLQAGSDFKWVSGNSTDLADPDNKDILNLGGSILAASALPAELQKLVATARSGDVFLYNGPDQLFYTLVVESAFASKAKTYQDVRQEVGKIVYAQKINEALEEWVGKLKEAYETEIFIVQDKL